MNYCLLSAPLPYFNELVEGMLPTPKRYKKYQIRPSTHEKSEKLTENS